MSKIVPVILTKDEAELKRQIDLAEHVSDLIQIDVLDGKFAANTTIGAEVIAQLLTYSRFEIQLMVVDPSTYIEKLSSANAVSRIIFPLETDEDVSENIYKVKQMGKQVGISINIETPVNAAIPYFDEIDLLLLMGVKIGFSGQKFDDSVLSKVLEVKAKDKTLALEIDGGMNEQSIPAVSRAGVDFIAVNSAFFKADDPYLAFEKLAKLASNTP